jgi:hypothetical protein
MKIILLVASCAMLTACAPKQLIVHDTVEVKVPVPVPCVTQIPPRPTYKLDETDLTGKSMYLQGNAVLTELEQRRAREAELEAVLQACVQTTK